MALVMSKNMTTYFKEFNMKKITDIRDKRPEKRLTADEIAERAYRKHFKSMQPEDEPECLASGKADKHGNMIIEEDKENGNKEGNE